MEELGDSRPVSCPTDQVRQHVWRWETEWIVHLEVAESIYNLGTRWANFYLVVEDGQAVLVDAGYPRYAPRLDAALAELDLGLGAIEAVFVTTTTLTMLEWRSASGQRAARPSSSAKGTPPPSAVTDRRIRHRASGNSRGGRA